MRRIEDASELHAGFLAFAEDVLELYIRADALRRLDVAEHLLEALEELAAAEPCCQDILDQGYARILRLPQPVE